MLLDFIIDLLAIALEALPWRGRSGRSGRMTRKQREAQKRDRLPDVKKDPAEPDMREDELTSSKGTRK
jgi:hypothetical protein